MDKLESADNSLQISVIIPAYNQSRYVSQAIQSVLEQTYPNFELIVVDDGSTDDTPHILANIHDPRMRVVRQPNGGLSAARNTGILESSAPLVSFLDADDFFFPDKLAILSSFLESHPEIGMVSGGVQIVDQDGRLLKRAIKAPDGLELTNLLVGNPFTPSAVLLRRNWLDRVGVFDETLRACEDWDLWQRLLFARCRFAWVEHPVLAYRYHPAQMTRESDRMRKALLTVLGKFFSQPDLPVYLRGYQDIAYATALVHAAAFAYHSKEFDKGQRDLAEAIRLDPSLTVDRYSKLVGLLVGWSNDPRSIEPTHFLKRIVENPPPGHPVLKRQLRRVLADSMLSPFFSYPSESRQAHRWDLVRVILYKPEWLLNRGVLRIFADAWLPF